MRDHVEQPAGTSWKGHVRRRWRHVTRDTAGTPGSASGSKSHRVKDGKNAASPARRASHPHSGGRGDGRRAAGTGTGRRHRVRRSVKAMADSGFERVFALEYEDGGWDGVEGAKYLYKETLAAP